MKYTMFDLLDTGDTAVEFAGINVEFRSGKAVVGPDIVMIVSTNAALANRYRIEPLIGEKQAKGQKGAKDNTHDSGA